MSRLYFAAPALALLLLSAAACERSPIAADGSRDARFLPLVQYRVATEMQAEIRQRVPVR